MKIDADKAFKLASDVCKALKADAVVIVAYKDGESCVDIVGDMGKPLPPVEENLRKLADQIEKGRNGNQARGH